jgi:hypothetical protein
MEPQPTPGYYVPTINFDTLSYVAGLGTAGKGRYDPQKFTYEGPSQALKRMTVAVGALGTVLPIDPPSSNSSWTTEFHGPAIRCETLPASEIKAVEQNIRGYIEYGSVCWNAPGYITWIGDLPYISSLPMDDNGSAVVDAEPVVQPNGQPLSDANGTFRLAVLPQLLTVYQMSDGQVHSACSPGYDFLDSYGNDTSLMLQCQLVNSTYNVAFDYVNGNQTVTIQVPQTIPEGTVAAISTITGPTNETSQIIPEDTVAAISTITGPTNKTCVGFHAGYLLKQPATPIENPDWPERCDFDQGLARQLAYRSILDAFFNVISGPVALDQSSAGNILATTLLRTRELNFLTNYARAMSDPLQTWKNAQSGLFAAGRADLAGLIVPEPENKRPALARELEVMFQNLTVSLMSSTVFQ